MYKHPPRMFPKESGITLPMREKRKSTKAKHGKSIAALTKKETKGLNPKDGDLKTMA